MTNIEKLMIEIQTEEAANARLQRDVFIDVIDRARVEQARRVKEDPMLMWDTYAKQKIHKLYDAENPGVIKTVEKEKDTFGSGFASGVAFAITFLLMAVLVYMKVKGV